MSWQQHAVEQTLAPPQAFAEATTTGPPAMLISIARTTNRLVTGNRRII
jgi:hypothetical protein